MRSRLQIEDDTKYQGMTGAWYWRGDTYFLAALLEAVLDVRDLLSQEDKKPLPVVKYDDEIKNDTEKKPRKVPVVAM